MSRDKSFIDQAKNRAENWNGSECWTNKINIVSVLDNAAVFPKHKSGCSWVGELDTLDFEAHPPFHKSQVPRYGDISRFEEQIVAASDQAVLSLDVGLHTLLFLGRIDKMDVLGIHGSPLLGCWACYSIGLCK